MVPPTLERRSHSWFDDHVQDWVGHGLISVDQADAIRHFEHLDDERPPQRLTVVAEVASYVGSLIAFAGGAAIIGPNWSRIGLVGQLLLAAAIAIVGFVTGTWLVRQADAGTIRLGCFLWVVGAGGVALSAAAIMNEVDPREEGWFAVAVGVPVLFVGLGLWRNLDRPLQLLTSVVGLFVAAAGVHAIVDVSAWISSPVVWVASLVFGAAAAAHRIRPRDVGLLVAAVGLMIASLSLSDESERLAAIVAVVTAAGIITYALVDRNWPLVGVGLFAFFVAITNMMQTVLQGTAARMVAVLLGLLVVAAVAIRAQRSARSPTA